MGIPVKNKKAVILLLLVSVAVYSNSLLSGFVWDDNVLIVKKQEFFSQPGNAIKIFALSDAPLGMKNPYYRPVNTFSYMLDHYLWGLHPFWYHLENVIIHAIVVVLFYLLLLEVFEDRRLSFLAALLFAIYPVNSEVVDFISARNTLFCGLFSIASLLLLVKGKKKMSLLAYFLALLSKEPAVILPFFLFFFGLTMKDERFKIKKELIGFFGITAIYFLIRHLVLGTFTSKAGISLSISRLKLMASVYFEHFMLFVFPFRLNALYTKKSIQFSSLKAVAAVCGVMLLLYLSLGKKSSGPLKTGAQWILWGLLPVSNLVKIPSAPLSERYQYTVLFGFVLILGYFLTRLQKRQAFAGAALTSLLFLVLGFRTFERNFAWQDNLSLYSSMVRSDPKNPLAHCYLGLTYERRGMLKRAEEECGASQRMDPGYDDAYVCLGLVFAKQGHKMESLQAFQKAVQAGPYNGEAHMDLAVAYMNEGRTADAEREFKGTIDLNSSYAGAHMDLAELYVKENKPVKAEHEFKVVLNLDPDDAGARSGLGMIYAKRGALAAAVWEFSKALAINPSLADTMMNLGVAYAKEGQLEDASQEFQKVLKQDPGNAYALQYLKMTENLLEKR